MKKDILSLNLEELTNEMILLGQPKFRAKQIYRWLHKSFVTDFSQMSDISLDLRNVLNDNFVIFGCSIEKKLISEYDSTIKYLFRLNDGEYVESVLQAPGNEPFDEISQSIQQVLTQCATGYR